MGVAMHAGNLPGYPASHGCVRLPMEFAKKLFTVTPMGGTVVIAGGNRPQWIQVGVADLASGPAEVISTERVEQMHLPAPFVAGMRSVMKPGTTVLVTQASVSGTTTGLQTTVMDAEKPNETKE
jgi:hypothetical protein